MLLKNVFKFVINLIFPINCYGCNLSGTYLCESCFRKLRFKESKKTDNYLVSDNLEAIYFAGDYKSELLSRLIISFKHEKIKDIGIVLSRFLNLFWQGKIAQIKLKDRGLAKDLEDVIVCPIPLSKKRKRFRGFNQSEVLAELFCKEFYLDSFRYLKRKNKIKNQADLKKTARLKNVVGVFYCKTEDAEEIKNRTILLIDDVTTTGATLNEAASALKSCGAKKVYALVLARA